MKVLVTGSSGLIGSALVSELISRGNETVRLVRTQPGPGAKEIFWEPEAGRLDAGALEGFDAVVHLAGVNIAAGRWTPKQKTKIRVTRVIGTRLLSETLAHLARRPAVLVAASAMGFYGTRGDEVLTESSPSGSGFLPEVCRAWEGATEPASRAGIRTVNLRTGVVLSARGGALAKMLTPFRLGLGGRLGDGKQYMSWIAIDDVVRVIQHAIKTATLSGPVNNVSPNPVTNAEFTKTLGQVLSRPTVFPMPGFAARLAFGEMADELLLSSTRLRPAKLASTGYVFRFPELEGALRQVLGKA